MCGHSCEDTDAVEWICGYVECVRIWIGGHDGYAGCCANQTMDMRICWMCPDTRYCSNVHVFNVALNA